MTVTQRAHGLAHPLTCPCSRSASQSSLASPPIRTTTPPHRQTPSEPTLTEIPEHLLKRAQAAKAKATGADAPAADAPAEATTASPATPAKEATSAPVIEKPPAPIAPYVAAARARKKIPWWAASALLLLPIWAISYVGTLERPPQEATGLLAEGQYIYENRCASCHGTNGGGGSGYKLADGEVLITFPTLEPMIEWLAKGSAGIGLGNPYGDPARGRIVAGGMPGWADVLTTEELIGVVLHERVKFGGSEEALAQVEAIEHAVEMGELDLQGHLDPSTITVDEIRAMLSAVGEDGSNS